MIDRVLFFLFVSIFTTDDTQKQQVTSRIKSESFLKILSISYESYDLKREYGMTPLIAASRFDEVDVCKYLVTEMKADVNLQDNDSNL